MPWSSSIAATQSTIAAAKRWQSRLFTSSGTWTVPADVGVIWIDCCGGGAGGGSGFASETSGGGGAGGASAPSYVQHHMPVTAGETLTLTVGAGGVGAVVGAELASYVTVTTIVGSISAVTTSDTGGWVSYSGTATAGGHAAGYGTIAVYGGTGAGGDNGAAFISTSTISIYGYTPRYAGNNDAVWQSGCAGGGPGYAGGASICGPRMGLWRVYLPGGAPTGSPGNGLGGGGSGGNSLYGTGGAGGAGGVAGADAIGYGAGGGGGGGNAPGGNGSPGFIRIYCFSATTI